jgi:hypothetical protein
MLKSHFTKYLNHENYKITGVGYDDRMVLIISTNTSSGRVIELLIYDG